MSTPLANKTTISSRNKLAQQLAAGGEHAPATTSKLRQTIATTMQPPPSQIARNPALKTPQLRLSTTTRISNLSNGIPTSTRPTDIGSRLHAARQNNTLTSNGTSTVARPPATSRISHIASRIPPATTKVDRRSHAAIGGGGLTSSRQSSATQSRLAGASSMSSRSPSVLSSVSSTHTLKSSQRDGRSLANNIPDTNSIRKGLAKFSNPMECQRQFLALNQKLRDLNDTLKARDNQVLKLDQHIDLPAECEQLKQRVAELEIKENGYKDELDNIITDYQNHIKVEQDLRAAIEKELSDTRLAHAKTLEDLSNAHRDELTDLTDTNTAIQNELTERIATLESDLDSKCKELSELRANYEALTTSFNKLEDSLTKDKDARVKYAQEKVIQLQKDVDSLNSVLEMKAERMHALEKDTILLAETQTELTKQKEHSKSLCQQLESLEAALEKRKEQYEILIAEHEKIRQELKHERLDRRRTNVRKSSEIFSTP